MSVVEFTKSQIALIHLLQKSYGIILLYINEGKSLADALKYLRDEIQKEIAKLEVKH